MAIADLTATDPDAAAERLGDNAMALHMDVTDPASIRAGIAAVEEASGGIDVLANNAGVYSMGRIDEVTPEEYRRVYDVNVGGTIFVTQAVVPGMRARGKGGVIINFASQAGRRGEPNVSIYCSTKAAIISLTQSFALEFAPDCIRVNAIAPGVIDTPMWDLVDSYFAEYEHRPIGEKKRLVGEAVPLGYMGRPEEIADPCVFLASDEARYITAQTLNVDGGNWMS